MQTRRQLLQSVLASAPLALSLPVFGADPDFEILSESDYLSEESARGFRRIAAPGANVIVVCGAGCAAKTRVPELFERAVKGKWIIWEHSPVTSDLSQILLRVFGIRVGPPLNPGLYIRYLCPHAALTRSFLQASSATCSDGEIIAQCDGKPIALKRHIGLGGIVFLGSMLGPNLHAREPEAHRIASALLRIAG